MHEDFATSGVTGARTSREASARVRSCASCLPSLVSIISTRQCWTQMTSLATRRFEHFRDTLVPATMKALNFAYPPYLRVFQKWKNEVVAIFSAEDFEDHRVFDTVGMALDLLKARRE